MQTEIEGLEQVGQMALALEALPGALADRAFNDGLIAAAREVVSVARRTTAFRDQTGNLRKSIRAVRGRRQYAPSALVVAGAPHSHLIERGHSRAPAHPFLVPAAMTARSIALASFVKGVRKNFNKVSAELRGRRRVSAGTRRALSV